MSNGRVPMGRVAAPAAAARSGPAEALTTVRPPPRLSEYGPRVPQTRTARDMTPAASTIALPLAGVRVIEFCSIAAGPFCGMLLADMGADVLKIEPPSGDALRTWPPINDGFSENFAS